MGLHDGHRQRAKERYGLVGADALADHELLELALFYAVPRQDTNETAHRLLKRFRSLQGVLQASPEELEQVEGVGKNAALLLHLMADMRQQTGESACLRRPRKAATNMRHSGHTIFRPFRQWRQRMCWNVTSCG